MPFFFWDDKNKFVIDFNWFDQDRIFLRVSFHKILKSSTMVSPITKATVEIQINTVLVIRERLNTGEKVLFIWKSYMH